MLYVGLVSKINHKKKGRGGGRGERALGVAGWGIFVCTPADGTVRRVVEVPDVIGLALRTHGQPIVHKKQKGWQSPREKLKMLSQRPQGLAAPPPPPRREGP
eukprot:gene44063-7188_t